MPQSEPDPPGPRGFASLPSELLALIATHLVHPHQSILADNYSPLLIAPGPGSDVPAASSIDIVALHLLSPRLLTHYLLATFHAGIVTFTDTHRAALFATGAFDRANRLLARARPTIRRVRIATWDPRRSDGFAQALREDRLPSLAFLHIGKRRQRVECEPPETSVAAQFPGVVDAEEAYFRNMRRDMARGVTGFALKWEDDWCRRLSLGAGPFGVCAHWIYGEEVWPWWHREVLVMWLGAFLVFFACSGEEKRRLGAKMDKFVGGWREEGFGEVDARRMVASLRTIRGRVGKIHDQGFWT